MTDFLKRLMLASGLLTSTMFYAVVAPQAALQSAFGQSLDGPVANIVVRNWGALIGLVGVMLIYGAFRPAVRPLVLAVATVSKVIFIGLVLALGREYLGNQIGVSVVIDGILVILFSGYLFRGGTGRQPGA